tara:strand:- start:81 stop:1049 length:969 start_codon:yes stop_codon:yes gene_type:complete
MEFSDFIEAIRSGLTELMACTDSGLELNAEFYGWDVGQEMGEKVFNTAIIAGLVNTQVASVQRIGCAITPNHVAFADNENMTFASSFKTSASRNLFAKDPDIVFADENGNTAEEFYPNWIIQVKKGVNKHPKACEALGDYLWGYIDKKYMEVVDNRRLNVAMVWFERDEDRGDDRWLHANVDEFEEGGDIDTMTLKFSPGYHTDMGLSFISENIGEMRFIDSRGQEPERAWISRNDRIITPNNKTVIKQMLGTGTNSSYVRMFTQPGMLEISSQFIQFNVDGMWCYIHLLDPDYVLENVADEDLPVLSPQLLNNERIFRWIP